LSGTAPRPPHARRPERRRPGLRYPASSGPASVSGATVAGGTRRAYTAARPRCPGRAGRDPSGERRSAASTACTAGTRPSCCPPCVAGPAGWACRTCGTRRRRRCRSRPHARRRAGGVKEVRSGPRGEGGGDAVPSPPSCESSERLTPLHPLVRDDFDGDPSAAWLNIGRSRRGSGRWWQRPKEQKVNTAT